MKTSARSQFSDLVPVRSRTDVRGWRPFSRAWLWSFCRCPALFHWSRVNSTGRSASHKRASSWPTVVVDVEVVVGEVLGPPVAEIVEDDVPGAGVVGLAVGDGDGEVRSGERRVAVHLVLDVEPTRILHGELAVIVVAEHVGGALRIQIRGGWCGTG
ncbi:MAG: hypothetical protein R2699_15650 [Acidimicrobiales bacterium]